MTKTKIAAPTATPAMPAITHPAQTATITVSSSSKDLDTSIDSLTAGALPYFRNIFRQLSLENPQNAGTLSQFLIALYHQSHLMAQKT